MKCLICECESARPVWGEGTLHIDECRGCRVLFTRDRPTEEELMRLYAEDALLGERPDPLAETEAPQPAWKVREHAWLLNCLAAWGMERGTLLDIGCFSGAFLGVASKRGFSCVGVEPNEDAYRHIRKAHGFSVVHGSLHSAQFEAERFSVVSYLDVIEHIPDPVHELREAQRIMEPGGWLILTTPNAKGLLQRVVKAKRWLTGEKFCPIDSVPWHLWGFSRGSLARCVEKAGFQVKDIRWLEPSPLSTNEHAGSTSAKAFALRMIAVASKLMGMSDRMALLARKA